MKTDRFTLASPVDGLPLNVLLATPVDGNIKGIIQIAHGMCEYIDRYEGAMKTLTGLGYAVAGNDHRGHGRSVRDEADLGWFYDKDGGAIIEDTAALTAYLKEQFPQKPLTLFGHSMGSMVARVYLQKYDTMLDSVVLCGAPPKNPLSGIAVFLADMVAAFKGERHRSGMLRGLSVGVYDKKFSGEGTNAWLSVDKGNVERYNADPLCDYTFTCNGFRNLFCLLRNTFRGKEYQVQKPTLPIFFIAGADDPVIGDKEQLLASAEFLRSVGYQTVETKVYDGVRHEILNEAIADTVLQDVDNFLCGIFVGV